MKKELALKLKQKNSVEAVISGESSVRPYIPGTDYTLTGYVAPYTSNLKETKVVSRLKSSLEENKQFITTSILEFKSKGLLAHPDKFSKLLNDLHYYSTSFLSLLLEPDRYIARFDKEIKEENKDFTETLRLLVNLMEKVIDLWNEAKYNNFINKKYFIYQEFSRLMALNDYLDIIIDHFMPIYPDKPILELYFSLNNKIRNQQKTILQIYKKIESADFYWSKPYFDSLRIQVSFSNERGSPDQLIKFYDEKIRSSGDLEKFKQISEYMYNIHNKRNHYKGHIPEEEIASIFENIEVALKINFFLAIPAISDYIFLRLVNINRAYGPLDLNFSAKIREFIETLNYTLIPHLSSVESMTTEDHDFIYFYEKIVQIDFHLKDITAFCQDVYCILALSINHLANHKEKFSDIVNFQKQQLQLLQIEKILLAFLSKRGHFFITRWSYLEENNTITTMDLNNENYHTIQHPFTSAKQAKIKEGFPINVILKMIDEIAVILSDNIRLGLIGFPQPVQQAEIIAKANQYYADLMQSEKKVQDQENARKLQEQKKSNDEKAKLNEKLFAKKIAKENKKISSGLDLKYPAPTRPSDIKSKSPQRLEFEKFQVKFNQFVREEADTEVKTRLLPLCETCQEPVLLLEINDYLGDYFEKTGIKNCYKNLLDPRSIARLASSLIYKKNAKKILSSLPKDHPFIVQKTFIKIDIANIEKILNDAKTAQQAEIKIIDQMLEELKAGRAMAMARLGPLWFKTDPRRAPSRKSLENSRERTRLLAKKNELLSVEGEITETKALLNMVNPTSSIRSTPPRTNERSAPIPKKETKNSAESLSRAIADFESYLDHLINGRMKAHGITAKPDFVFPRGIITSLVKLVSSINNYLNNPDDEVYISGEFMFHLIQRKAISEPASALLALEIITNAEAGKLVNWARQQKLQYKLQLNEKGLFTKFSVYFEDKNITVISIPEFKFAEEVDLRDITVRSLYLTVGKDYSIEYLTEEDDLLLKMIDSCLLEIPTPRLIKASTNVLMEQDIAQLNPMWSKPEELYPDHHQQLSPDDFTSLDYTIKNFIVNPAKLLQIYFDLTYGLIKFVNFDNAMQLCFVFNVNNSNPALIISSYSTFTGQNPAKAALIIFDRFIKYILNKASDKNHNMVLGHTGHSRKILANNFRTMMSKLCEQSYFLTMFSLPLMMFIKTTETHKEIEVLVKNFFANSEHVPEIYRFLCKKLVCEYTSSNNNSLEKRLLPFVIGLIAYNYGYRSLQGEVKILIKNIIEVSQLIPGLRDLYLNIQEQEKLSPDVEESLLSLLKEINQTSNLLVGEEKHLSISLPPVDSKIFEAKSSPAPKKESKTEIEVSHNPLLDADIPQEGWEVMQDISKEINTKLSLYLSESILPYSVREFIIKLRSFCGNSHISYPPLIGGFIREFVSGYLSHAGMPYSAFDFDFTIITSKVNETGLILEEFLSSWDTYKSAKAGLYTITLYEGYRKFRIDINIKQPEEEFTTDFLFNSLKFLIDFKNARTIQKATILYPKAYFASENAVIQHFRNRKLITPAAPLEHFRGKNWIRLFRGARYHCVKKWHIDHEMRTAMEQLGESLNFRKKSLSLIDQHSQFNRIGRELQKIGYSRTRQLESLNLFFKLKWLTHLFAMREGQHHYLVTNKQILDYLSRALQSRGVSNLKVLYQIHHAGSSISNSETIQIDIKPWSSEINDLSYFIHMLNICRQHRLEYPDIKDLKTYLSLETKSFSSPDFNYLWNKMAISFYQLFSHTPNQTFNFIYQIGLLNKLFPGASAFCDSCNYFNSIKKQSSDMFEESKETEKTYAMLNVFLVGELLQARPNLKGARLAEVKALLGDIQNHQFKDIIDTMPAQQLENLITLANTVTADIAHKNNSSVNQDTPVRTETKKAPISSILGANLCYSPRSDSRKPDDKLTPPTQVPRNG